MTSTSPYLRRFQGLVLARRPYRKKGPPSAMGFISGFKDGRDGAVARRRRATIHALPTIPRALEEGDVDAFMDAASARPYDELFKEMDDLLRVNRVKWPTRSRRMQRDLRWLRKLARKEGKPWG